MAGLADPPVGHPIGDPVQADPAASGTRRCTASSFVLPHVTADTRRPSSRLDRHVSGPSGDRSGMSVARSWRVWKKWALIFMQWRGAHPCPLSGEKAGAEQRGAYLPPCGGDVCEADRGGHGSACLERAHLGEDSPPSVTYGDISPARGEIGACPDRLGCQQNEPDWVSTFRYRQSPLT
ncbi:hypothetical protein HOE425_320236 [Hoeflea sp. EC-HK425]|nr:hypothetical protein HOE425_320236 [Hoeflea sp. EC-HK425]